MRVNWDKYEVAVLIDTYFKIIKCETSQQKEVLFLRLSCLLRNYAVLRGIEIDEKYRNLNGMRMQMSCMEYLITKGKKGIPGSSKVFKEVYQLYETNPVQFAAVLKETKKRMISDAKIPNNIEDKFSEWLAGRYNSIRANEIFLAFAEADAFLIESHGEEGSAYSLRTPEQVYFATVFLKKEFFKNMDYRQVSMTETAMKDYHMFVANEKEEVSHFALSDQSVSGDNMPVELTSNTVASMERTDTDKEKNFDIMQVMLGGRNHHTDTCMYDKPDSKKEKAMSVSFEKLFNQLLETLESAEKQHRAINESAFDNDDWEVIARESKIIPNIIKWKKTLETLRIENPLTEDILESDIVIDRSSELNTPIFPDSVAAKIPEQLDNEGYDTTIETQQGTVGTVFETTGEIKSIAVELLGKQYEVYNSGDLYVKVCEMMLLHRPYIIAIMDKDTEFNTEGHKNFSYIKSEIEYKPKRLSNGLWIETDQSDEDIIKSCYTLLEKCGFAHEELKYKVVEG